jgi:hypothetical protein
MTVREVARALGVSIETVRSNGKSLFPDLFENGKTTYLNEGHATAIKLRIAGHHNLQNTLEVKNAQTLLEKQLIIRQAMILQQEIIDELEKENSGLRRRLDSARQILDFRTSGLQTYQRIAEAGGLVISDRDDIADTYRGRR